MHYYNHDRIEYDPEPVETNLNNEKLISGKHHSYYKTSGLVSSILNRCPYDHVFWNRLKISGFDVVKIKHDKRKSKLGKKQFLGSYFTKAELTKIYNTVVNYEDQYWHEVIVDESTLTKAK